MTESAQVTARRPRSRSRFVAILVYTLQSCVPPKRWVALLLPCAGALLFGLLAHAMNASAERAFANVAAEGIFALVMPIAALVIGDAVLGAELRAGTFHFTWLSPARDLADRARAVARRLAGRPRHDRSGQRTCGGGGGRAEQRGAGVRRRRNRQHHRMSPCSSPSAASLDAPPYGRWRSCS